MTRWRQCGLQSVGGLPFLAIVQGLEQAQAALRIVARVWRPCWRMPGHLVPIQELGILLMQVAAIGQENSAQIVRRRTAVHRPSETLAGQEGQLSHGDRCTHA